ncbi:MAG TPA: DinB family protein [Pirellulales bacterium]|nr:DinB family protein [Pirellulales bacterium]
MDILDRLLGHDSWTTRQLLVRCRELTDEQLDTQFDIAHRSVRATLLHMIRNMEVWTDLIAEQPIRPNQNNLPEGRSVDGLLRRLDIVSADLAAVSTRLQRENKLDECFVDHLDDPPRKKPYGGAIVHVITHSMHHRAQLLYLLRLLGLQNLPEGDALGWEMQLRRNSS